MRSRRRRASGAIAFLVAAIAPGSEAAAQGCPAGAPRVVVAPSAGAPPDGDLLAEIALALTDVGVDAHVDVPAEPVDGCAHRIHVTVEPGFAPQASLRLELSRPSEKVRLFLVERVEPSELAARAVVMARDLLAAARAMPSSRRSEVLARPSPAPPTVEAPRADAASGTLPLAVGSTALGGFTGLGVYLATGADDPRILYPILATGAGIGLGGSLLVSGEWDVTSSDAWFVIAGGLWPTAAGHLIYEGRFADRGDGSDDRDRWTFGLVGTTAGLGLTTLAVALRRPTEGDAALVHSGAAYGSALGGLAEYAARGDIRGVPAAGLGYGAAVGWLAAGTLSLQVDVAPADVLALDLGASLGGLGGAALASPLLFDDPSPDAQRAFLGVAAGSTLIGAGVAWWLAAGTSTGSREGGRSQAPLARPTIGVIGESVLGSRRAPVYGASFIGAMP